jgi:hypothetical protein
MELGIFAKESLAQKMLKSMTVTLYRLEQYSLNFDRKVYEKIAMSEIWCTSRT